MAVARASIARGARARSLSRGSHHVIDSLLSLWSSVTTASVTSTVGVAPALKKLTREHPEVRVALSLHAPSQELRAKIVPAAKQWPLHELIEALDDHLNSVARHSGSHDGLMIEYVLLKGVNDRREDADQLIALLRGKPVMLNLIPYNPNVTATLHGFEAPSIESCRAFGKVIIEGGLRVRLREEFGQDINAACGHKRF